MLSFLGAILPVLLVVAVLHAVYEGIVLPSVRLRLRYRLFALRDELRRVKIAQGSALSEKVFVQMEDSMNSSLRFLHMFDLRTVVMVDRAMSSDARLREIVEARLRLLDQCEIVELREIRSRHGAVLRWALIANNGAWFLYVIPLLAFMLVLHSLRRVARALGSLPEKEMGRIIPANG